MSGPPGAAAVPDLWSGALGRRLALPEVTAAADGSFVARAEPDADLLGQRETVFGGWLACVVDHVAGVATAAHLGSAAGFLTADLRVRFVRPVDGKPVTFTAVPRGVGARLVDVAVRVEQFGVLCCQAELTQVISRG
ncbi:PaaI family thioesterase [Saccharothrix algeriensis]|uniref:Acyl-coenzyme A thioesterase PaaI-like protein n=1 Tax=Saccharothrix algeriensis TaxID=173560 RepID=A0ABS2S241_9PSEU|nr:PaaI family thioesterase [Saccharothrix algeriensis]MBM7810306.1 acyl-coenzyme A thioesterase PaaI-like protein [Saccharothrix algeriensis]